MFNPLEIKGNYQDVWDVVKEYFGMKLDNMCELCCEDIPEGGRMEVHHRNSCPLDNRIENLMGLCPKCHRRIHAEQKMKRREKEGRVFEEEYERA